jgi:hypothetical protein
VTVEWQGPHWFSFAKEWEAMRVFNRVTAVTISFSRFDEKMVRHLARFERLEKLHVQTASNTPQQIAEMARPLKLKELWVNGRLVETLRAAKDEFLACTF